mmetsp:Transcript_8027/g.17393  ORF Transcript_8027/g.17393 Transcript_8027/m.17393 type:complete len:576 (-) Transcript_8027:93-1820(-)
MSGGAQPNFYLWGCWKSRIIKEPFLTKKVPSPLKKIVLGETFIIGLKEKGQVVSWGKDAKNGCLGLGKDKRTGEPIVQADAPQDIEGLTNVTDIQMGQDHVVALNDVGEVFTWGRGDKGQLGHNDCENRWKPQKVEKLSGEQIMQIAVVRNSTFALSTSGVVYAWGDNKDNTLGLEDTNKAKVEDPVRLALLGEMRVRKLEIFENRTIIAHVRAPETDEGFLDVEVAPPDDKDETEVEIFKGIDEMRKAMEKTQEWWNHLLNIKHGQPYDMSQDGSMSMTEGAPTGLGGPATIQDDLNVEPEKLKRAERHLNALVNAAIGELKRTQQMPGTRNVRFILCMFIDECRLRSEKVQRTISARQLVDAKRRAEEAERISAYSVMDFGANAQEEIRKIIAVTKVLQKMLEEVKVIEPMDVYCQELKLTLIECLESKLQLHDTRVELLKAAEAKPSDPMLPALRIVKDRWNSLKHFSLYNLYLECENEKKEFGNDEQHLAYLVQKSNEMIDQMLQIDKDRIISHDTLVPALCYDLLRENAELRKMTNSYQLHVLMLHQGKRISGASVGLGRPADALTGGDS